MTSANPVLVLASGLNSPDDLYYSPDDGSVLVGEHGDGHIARIVSPGNMQRLAQVVPEAEGITIIGGTTYVADQLNARVVALTDTGIKTVLQLQPVPSGENLDGISSTLDGSGLVVPDSPHGTVLFVDINGHVTQRLGGFSRPAGVAPDPKAGGYLVADENASAVFEIQGTKVTRLRAGLPGADDAIRARDGHVLVILPGAGVLQDATTGRNLATGLRNPQGLGLDGAWNVLLAESDSGRVDLLVNSVAVEVPSGTVQLAPAQGICFALVRAPGNQENVVVNRAVGAVKVVDPGSGSQGEVVPARCPLELCTMTVELQVGGQALPFQLSYRD